MSVHDLCCIGYITQDKIVTTKNTIYMPGGTSFYLHMPLSISIQMAFIGYSIGGLRYGHRGRDTERGH